MLLSLRARSIGFHSLTRKRRTIKVEPGALVGEIKRTAAAAGLLFAPDPTSEEESTIGGAIACNASGARTFKYGATRRHVRALKVVMASGELIELRRPDLEKNTVGYAFAHDPIDWFIGSEGTLGIIVEAELSLLPLPDHVVGLAVLVQGRTRRAEFRHRGAGIIDDCHARCIEYFDGSRDRNRAPASAGFTHPAGREAMVYVEEEIPDDLDSALVEMARADRDRSAPDFEPLVFDGEARLREARKIRHSIPATMNERGNAVSQFWWKKSLDRLGSPVPEAAGGDRDCALTGRARPGSSEPVIYGHAGNGHPHQNFMARDARELATIEGAVEETLKRVLALGGTVAAEHGIGKIKRRWLPLQMNALQISMMTAVKRELDPLGILAPGNIL